MTQSLLPAERKVSSFLRDLLSSWLCFLSLSLSRSPRSFNISIFRFVSSTLLLCVTSSAWFLNTMLVFSKSWMRAVSAVCSSVVLATSFSSDSHCSFSESFSVCTSVFSHNITVVLLLGAPPPSYRMTTPHMWPFRGGGAVNALYMLNDPCWATTCIDFQIIQQCTWLLLLGNTKSLLIIHLHY